MRLNFECNKEIIPRIYTANATEGASKDLS